MVKLMGPTALKVCANQITITTVKELLKFDNLQLTSILNPHFAVGAASN